MIPLPLTTLEEFLLWEDRPAYPWNPLVRVRFTGRLDRPATESAWNLAVSRHPFLMSKVEWRGKRWYWVEADTRSPMVWAEAPNGLTDGFPPFAPLSLPTGTGIRAYVTVAVESSDLVVQFHHACCDGAGFFAFLNDFFIAYALERGESSSAIGLPEYDPSRLATRGRYGLTRWKLLTTLPRHVRGVHGIRRFVDRRPSPVTPHAARPDDDRPPPGYPAAVRYALTQDDTIRFRRSAQRRRVRVNDVLARDVFLALTRWRRDRQCGSDQEWLRLMVPVNLRSHDHRALPAANVVSSIFLDRRGEDAVDPGQLLKTIHDEMALAKRHQLGLTFLFSLEMLRWLPGGLRKATRTDRCMVSCILTNLGRLLGRSPLPTLGGRLVVGETRLESFELLAPIRPYSCTTFCAHQYAGRLVMDLHYDPGILTGAQAHQLIDIYAEQARASLADA